MAHSPLRLSLFSRLMLRLGYVSLREHDLVIGRDGRAEPRIKPLPGYSFMRADGFAQTEPAYLGQSAPIGSSPGRAAIAPARVGPQPVGKRPAHTSAQEVRRRMAAGTRPRPPRNEEAEWERLLAEARARAEHIDDDIPVEQGDTWVSPAPIFRNDPRR